MLKRRMRHSQAKSIASHARKKKKTLHSFLRKGAKVRRFLVIITSSVPIEGWVDEGGADFLAFSANSFASFAVGRKIRRL